MPPILVESIATDQPGLLDLSRSGDGSSSAVTWGAITAGAFAGAALSLILLALGAGAGLSSLSPWSTSEVSRGTVGLGALAWLAVTQVVAGSLCGYVAGRLRTRWVNVHSHEVYFRDTAHGFLAWAVAMVACTAFFGAAGSVMAGGLAASPSAQRSDRPSDASQYFVDRLFRAEPPATPASAAVRADAAGVLAHSLAQRELAADDRAYLVTTVANQTGLSRADAEARVNNVFTDDQQAIDSARKATSHALYWLVVALLLGAFTSSWSATLGGARRDRSHLPQGA